MTQIAFNPDIARWVAENPGVQGEIAEKCGCDRSFVSAVLHGRRKSRDGAVERELRERGAPL